MTLTRKAAELEPLKLKWPKPCIGICQWKLMQVRSSMFPGQGATREEVYAQAKIMAAKRPCIGLCYLNKMAQEALRR